MCLLFGTLIDLVTCLIKSVPHRTSEILVSLIDTAALLGTFSNYEHARANRTARLAGH